MDARIPLLLHTIQLSEIGGAKHPSGSAGYKKGLPHQAAPAKTVQALQDAHGEDGAAITSSAGIDKKKYGLFFLLPRLPPAEYPQHIGLVHSDLFIRT